MMKQTSPRNEARQIVGISMSPAMASEVKAEAGRRNITLRKLFEEMWAAYKPEKARRRDS